MIAEFLAAPIGEYDAIAALVGAAYLVWRQ